MTYYLTKIVVTTTLIIVVSELSKRSSFMGALFASIPLISVCAMFWLYNETSDTALVSSLAKSIFWMVLPSLALFISLPLLLKTGLNFYSSITIAIGITIGCYLIMVAALNFYGVKL